MQTSANEQLIAEVEKLEYEEFLSAHDGIRAEWVGGEVIMVPPASDIHQDLIDFLAAVLRIYIA